MRINDKYLNLKESYLFSDPRGGSEYKEKTRKGNYQARYRRRYRPLPAAVIAAVHKAIDEQSSAEGFATVRAGL